MSPHLICVGGCSTFICPALLDGGPAAKVTSLMSNIIINVITCPSIWLIGIAAFKAYHSLSPIGKI